MSKKKASKIPPIKPFYIKIGLIALTLLIGTALFLSKPTSTPNLSKTSHAGIDQFMQDVQQIRNGVEDYSQLHSGESPMFASSVSTTHPKTKELQALYQKSTEELKEDLLRPVQATERSDFHQELKNLFQVHEHQAFFNRQIEYARLKIDLAVVGMGIIRVDEVLKGQNPTVQEKDRAEFIKYIRDQVQSALASNDANFKAIVFKGLESSSS